MRVFVCDLISFKRNLSYLYRRNQHLETWSQSAIMNSRCWRDLHRNAWIDRINSNYCIAEGSDNMKNKKSYLFFIRLRSEYMDKLHTNIRLVELIEKKIDVFFILLVPMVIVVWQSTYHSNCIESEIDCFQEFILLFLNNIWNIFFGFFVQLHKSCIKWSFLLVVWFSSNTVFQIFCLHSFSNHVRLYSIIFVSKTLQIYILFSLQTIKTIHKHFIRYFVLLISLNNQL